MDCSATPITGFPLEMWEKICQDNSDNFNKGFGKPSGSVEEFEKSVNSPGARILYFGDNIPLYKKLDARQ